MNSLPLPFLSLLGIIVVAAVSRGEIVIQEDLRFSTNAHEQVGEFLRTIRIEGLRSSVGGVCCFAARANWTRMVLDAFLLRNRTTGHWTAAELVVVRLCDVDQLCPSERKDTETRCELSVVVVEKGLHEHLQALSSRPFWSPSAVHLFLSDGSTPRETDHQLTETLAAFGITRSLFVVVSRGALVVHFPILFQRRVLQILPADAPRWLLRFDQLADLHGYRYRTLYHTRIPYLYRSAGRFGGPDYSFLQTVLERQNAAHQWVYHQSTDAALNSTDLHDVDRRLLERGAVSFSLNRLLSDGRRGDALEKLFLNTFDGTCVLVPREALPAFILRLWEPFSPLLWYMVLATTLLAAGGNLALPARFTVNYLLALMFGGRAVGYRLKATDRTILLVLDVLLFLLREAYTAKIVTYMIQQQYAQERRTLVELARTGPPLLLTPGDYGALRERLAAVPDLRIVLREDFSSFDTSWRDYFRPAFAHAVPCSYGQALVGSASMREPGAPQFYVLRERLAIQPEAFTFPRHQPFVEKLRLFVASLAETGIFESWLRGDHYARDHSATVDSILRFEKLSSLFYGLLLGYAVSLGVFLVEQVASKVRTFCPLQRPPQ